MGEEEHLQGAPVSEGIAIGKPFFIASLDDEDGTQKISISQDEIEKEIARYRKALSSSRKDLKKLHEKLSDEGSQEAQHIIDTHIQMLSDPFMTTHVEELIRKRQQNTEEVFRTVMGDYQEKLRQSKDSLFRQRIVDVIDLSHRVLGHLRSKTKNRLSRAPPNSIIFAKELVPSETAAAAATRVRAFVTQIGGGSSHAALIARSKGIPFVASIDIQLLKQACGNYVIVNGLTGNVIINPSEKTLEKYQELQNLLKSQSKQIEKEVHLTPETLDGHLVNLYANVGSLLELGEAQAYNAQGIGLFRTEFLISEQRDFFQKEEKQFRTYRKAALAAKNLPLVMRLFDIGGDKFPELILEMEKGVTSLTGCRGIRFLLRHEILFKAQIRALLRASAYGDIRLLIPLISDMNELRETKRIIEEVQKELKKKKIEVKKLPLGCLIEVPAAVMISDELAKECDFFSIGTNDLIHYLLGIDRSQVEMSAYYFPAHPSVIRMIKQVVESARKHNIPVTLCGEIASNPLFIPLLLGLGIDTFSCFPRYLPIIKRIVRQCKQKQAMKLAEAMLKCHTPTEIVKQLKKNYRKMQR